MSSKTEAVVIENATNHPERADRDKEENIDKSVLDIYMTDDNQIAPDIIEGLRCNDRNVRLEAVTKLRQLASSRLSIAIQPILDSDLLSTIIEMTCSEDLELQSQAIRILPVLTCGSPEQVSAVVEAGGLSKLISLASATKSDYIRNRAFLVLGNIGLAKHLGTKLVEEGGLKPMLDVLANPSMYAKTNLYRAADALSSYAHGNEENIPEHEVARIIPVLSKYILYQQDERAESLQESLHSLQHILTDEPSVNKAYSETGLIPRLVHLCTSQSFDTRELAYLCVNQIVLHSVDGVEDLINAGILDAFKTRIAIGNGEERNDTCFTASRIVLARLGHAKALIEAGLVPILVKLLLDQEEHAGSRNNVVWTLGRATRWGQDHHEILDTLLKANALEAFCSGLTLIDSKVVDLALKSILVFLSTEWEGRERAVERVKAGDGIERLRVLRFRSDVYRTELHKMAQTILRDHFPEFSLPARI